MGLHGCRVGFDLVCKVDVLGLEWVSCEASGGPGRFRLG